MIVFLTLIYVAFLFVLIKVKVLPNSAMTWMTTIVWMVVLFIFLFIPMQWGAPLGKVSQMTRVVQIVPNVTGQVVSISATPNVPVKKGELLFTIDPTPFEIAVAQAKATRIRVQAAVEQDLETLRAAKAGVASARASQKLAQTRYDDDAKLVDSGSIPANRLDQRQERLDSANSAVDRAEADLARAESEAGATDEDGVAAKLIEADKALEQAEWNLEQATVEAPSDGYVTNLALSVGQRVSNLPFAPAMAFVDTSETVLVAQIHQIFLRHVEPGQPVEIAFKIHPGKVLFGTVETVMPAASQGQAMVSGNILAATEINAEPFLVRIKLDNPEDEELLRPGVAGSAAIYTQSVAATHVIRKVMIRMEAILNYIRPGF